MQHLRWHDALSASGTLRLLRSYAARARALRRRLLFEGDLLSFGQPSEIALYGGPMEEELLPAVVANEPEPFVVNDPFNPSLRHNDLLSSLSSLSRQE